MSSTSLPSVPASPREALTPPTRVNAERAAAGRRGVQRNCRWQWALHVGFLPLWIRRCRWVPLWQDQRKAWQGGNWEAWRRCGVGGGAWW